MGSSPFLHLLLGWDLQPFCIWCLEGILGWKFHLIHICCFGGYSLFQHQLIRFILPFSAYSGQIRSSPFLHLLLGWDLCSLLHLLLGLDFPISAYAAWIGSSFFCICCSSGLFTSSAYTAWVDLPFLHNCLVRIFTFQHQVFGCYLLLFSAAAARMGSSPFCIHCLGWTFTPFSASAAQVSSPPLLHRLLEYIFPFYITAW